MNRKILHYLIALIFGLGIYGASGLVLKEYQLKQVCPQILSIPACYIVMACLIIPFIAHVFNLSNKIYFTGTGIALSIATYGSITNLLSFAECPKTSGGTPMCYISFLLFFSLVMLKWINIRIRNAR